MYGSDVSNLIRLSDWEDAVKRYLFSLMVVVFLGGFAVARLCPEGDLSGDCKVYWEDIKLFTEQWLDSGGCSHPGCADFDGVNGINFADFAALANHWGERGISLVINEFVASNDNNVPDPQGEYDDWVEIYNFGDANIDVGGMYLTDDLDEPTKWQIPQGYPSQTTVPADGFIVFWADGDTADGPLHADFKLSADGEEIGLFDTDGSTLIDGIVFGEQTTNISYGRYPDGNDDLRFFYDTTPLAENNGAYAGLVEDVEFSRERGFYEEGFNVTIATATNGANVYYTTDGSKPVENEVNSPTSLSYTGAIPVSTTTCLRAAAIKSGWMPSRTITHTYIFNASDKIRSLLVISIVGDEHEDLFEPNGIMAIVGGTYVNGQWTSGGTGTYNNPMQRGREYERGVSAELVCPNNNSGFQEDCGIRVQGSDYHRVRYRRDDPNWFGYYNYNKFSFKLYFRNNYGSSQLEYPLFPFSDIGRWRCIVLRGGHNDMFNPFIQDELVRRLHRDMGAMDGTGIMANIFLNGEYKAYYNPCERIDEELLQEWYNSEESWDVITQSDVRDGNEVAWNAMLDYVRSNDMSNNTNYQEAGNRVDIKGFIDYLILELYTGNRDWPNNNWIVAAEYSDQPIFSFYVWDTELALSEFSLDKVGFDIFPSWQPNYGKGLNGEETPLAWIYRALKANNEFRQLFADRVHKHFNNGGALTNSNILTRFYELRDDMLVVIPAMSTYIPNTWVPQRRSVVLNAFAGQGLFGPLEAPIFNINGGYQYGGYVSTSDTFTITDPCSSGNIIYYTIDGNDPRVPFTGAVSPSAIEYTSGFTVDKSTNLKSRIYKSSTGQWSALTEAIYGINGVADNLRITELMYHPIDTNDINDPNTEYIELKNIGGSAINLNLVSFTNGIGFTFGDVELAAGGHILVVKDQNAFEARYGTGKPIAGQYTGSLANDGERIELEDARGTTILNFRYSDNWRSITDGDGYSLTIINPANPDVNSWDKKDSWQASAYINGSPGTDDSGIIPNPGEIVINEVMVHTDTYPDDWIELYNTTTGPIDIGGWYLSDNDANLFKYRFATGTTIPAYGFVVVSEDVNFGSSASDPGRLIPFALSENGEVVCLTSALDGNSVLTGYREKEDFDASEKGVSFGRYYKGSTDNFNFVAMDHNTSGSANAYPKVGPIVITEIMYNPDWPEGGSYENDQYEYIELYNTGSGPVTLYDYTEDEPWKFTDGIDFTLPASPNEVTIPPGGRILVVKNPTAFNWRYPGLSAVTYGPYDGKLDNAGEKVQLSKPGDEDAGVRYYIRVDRISYSDGSHLGGEPGDVDLWPTQADGAGKSLTRISTTLYGNDPNNWTAATPTPGS
jgi:hypothetical protein